MKVSTMKTIRLTYHHDFHAEELPATACAFGFFDGVHRGHQKLIQAAIDQANDCGMKSAIMTFHPHPKDVLKQPSTPMKYITPLQQKEAIMEELGIDYLYVVTFNHTLAALTPKEFINHFVENLHIKHVIGGFDYSFGHKGLGTMETMKEEAKGRYETTIIPKYVEGNEKISSTAVRTYLENGNVEEVTHLLGRPFTIIGTVVTGEKRGRTIGFPTANIQCKENALLPTIGVYAVTLTVNGDTYQGMANIGYKPTFHDKREETTLEVNIFDFSKDIYGEEVQVAFYTFIREEKAFNGIEELTDQLTNDKNTIQCFFQKEK